MRLPGFTAGQSLPAAGRHRAARAGRRERAGAVVPALPFCDNCDEILDRCAANGGKPRAVCRACAEGRCYSGVEVLPETVPGFPPGWFPSLPRW
jgi:hypothetical protein